jgi:hypothetical protein
MRINKTLSNKKVRFELFVRKSTSYIIIYLPNDESWAKLGGSTV